MLAFYAWLRRHPLLVDGLLALAVAAGIGGSPRPPHVPLLVTIPFVLAMAIPVMFRRQHPAGAFVAVVAVGAAEVAVLSWPLGSDLSVLILLYTQLRRMLLAEALLMTALAVGLGFGLGITFGLIMTDALGASAGGREVTSIPYAQIALYAAISACAAQLAAVLPARRAVRTAVVASMADA